MKTLFSTVIFFLCLVASNHVCLAQYEIPASFVGGAEAYHSYLDQNLKYPLKAYKSGKDYKVKVIVIIQADGKAVIDNFLSDSSGLGFEEEVSRFIEGMPLWNPAKHSGVNSESQIILSFYFHLETQTNEVVVVENSTEVMKPKHDDVGIEETDIPAFYDGDYHDLSEKVKSILMTTFEEPLVTGDFKIQFEVAETGNVKKLVFLQNNTNMSEAQLSYAFLKIGNWHAALFAGQKVNSTTEIRLTFD